MYAYMSIVSPVHILTLFFTMLAFYFYLLWRESKHIRYYIGILFSIFLACNMDWCGYYAAVVLFVYHFFVEKTNRIWAIFFIVANIIILGIFLFHLYLLDPVGLYPLKTFFTAEKRFIIYTPFSLFDYIKSEFREIAIYFTVSIIALSVLWFIKIIFFKRDKLDYFILFTLLLGLDEILFPIACYPHFYCTHPLVVFFSLSAICGLAFLKEQLFKRIKVIGIIVIILLVSGFLIQSTVVLYRRFTKVMYYEFHYKMAKAILEKTTYNDKIIIVVYNLPWHTPFYADRYFLTYNFKEQFLIETYTSKQIEGIDLNNLKDFILRNEKGFKWVITTNDELVADTVQYFQKIKSGLSKTEFNSLLREFYNIEIKGNESELYKFLDANYSKEIYKGFIFFKLK